LISPCQADSLDGLVWVDRSPERARAGGADAFGEVKPMLGTMSTSMRRAGGPGRAAQVKALVNMPLIVDATPQSTVHA
jgi:hypothetical protein